MNKLDDLPLRGENDDMFARHGSTTQRGVANRPGVAGVRVLADTVEPAQLL
jgi:hypothetical protein